MDWISWLSSTLFWFFLNLTVFGIRNFSQFSKSILEGFRYHPQVRVWRGVDVTERLTVLSNEMSRTQAPASRVTWNTETGIFLEIKKRYQSDHIELMQSKNYLKLFYIHVHSWNSIQLIYMLITTGGAEFPYDFLVASGNCVQMLLSTIAIATLHC